MEKKLFTFALIIAAVILVLAVFVFDNKRDAPPSGTDESAASSAVTDAPDTAQPVTTSLVTDSTAQTEPVTTEPVTEPVTTLVTEPVIEPPETVAPSVDYSGSMPVISIVSDGEVVSLTEYVTCTVSVTENDSSVELPAQVRVRGNSSAYYGNADKIRESGGKVPYKIKLDKKGNLLGLNDGNIFRDWVLLRADSDGGSINNDVILRLGRAIVSPHEYCSDGRFVRLFLNGVDLGPYLLCEQNEVKKNRVNINEPENGDTSLYIGYYLQIENSSGEVTFKQNYASATVTDIEGTKKKFKSIRYSIKSDFYSDEQVDFIDRYMNDVFKIVYEACENGKFLAFDGSYNVVDGAFADAESTVGAVLDLPSIVNMYILYEIAHDYDVGEGSFYMYVDLTPGLGDGLVHFTSPWDFDWICRGSATDKFWAATFCEDSFADKYGERGNPWFIVLYKQDWFRRLVCERWGELRATGAIDAALEEENIVISMYSRDIGVSTKAKVLSWIRERIAWLDTVWIAE